MHPLRGIAIHAEIKPRPFKRQWHRELLPFRPSSPDDMPQKRCNVWSSSDSRTENPHVHLPHFSGERGFKIQPKFAGRLHLQHCYDVKDCAGFHSSSPLGDVCGEGGGGSGAGIGTWTPRTPRCAFKSAPRGALPSQTTSAVPAEHPVRVLVPITQLRAHQYYVPDQTPHCSEINSTTLFLSIPQTRGCMTASTFTRRKL